MMEMKVMTVTPHQAAKWLEKNIVGNRKINDKRVSFYADQIKRGIWKVTHQGVAFDSEGNLIDGQHRLSAIVQAETPVQIAVISNAESSSFDAIDGGMPRSLKDRTGIDKEDVAVCSIFYRIAIGDTGAAIAVNDIEYIYEKLYPHFTLFREYKNKCRKGITVAPVQGAAILHMAEGHGTYAAEQYRALVRLDFEDMPKVVRAFYKQTVNGKITGSSTDRMNAMARAYRAFDKKDDPDASHIQIRDEEFAQKRLKAKIISVLDI